MTLAMKRTSDNTDSLKSPKKAKFEGKSFNDKKSFKPKTIDKNSSKNGSYFKNGNQQQYGHGNNYNSKYSNDGKWQGNFGKGQYEQQNQDQQPPEKVDWNKLKQEKKDLKLKRKKNKNYFEVIAEAKQLYEKLKCKNAEDKPVIVKQLHNLLKGGNKYEKIVMAHDTARIVQCLVKYAPADIKHEIYEELLPFVVKMATSKYAHFCVERMIKYGTCDIRKKVIDNMFGSIVKMTTHAMSNNIIDIIYMQWATNLQKAWMRQEFYGDMYKNSKDDKVANIADTYKDEKHMKKAIVGAVKSNIEHAINKKLIDNSLIHSILLDFLNECDDNDRIEMAAIFSPLLPQLASTKDGTNAAIICFYNLIAKDRRTALKEIKTHINKICTHEFGYILMLSIFSSMDDTKLLKKNILDQIMTNIETIIGSEWGCKIIEWIVAPGDKQHFHPKLIEKLDEGCKFGKKDVQIRRDEILQSIVEDLSNAIVKNPDFYLKGGRTGLATAAIVKILKGDQLKNVLNALGDVINNPEWKVKPIEIGEQKIEPANTKISITEPQETDKTIKKKKIFKSPYDVEKTDEEKKMEEDELIFGIEHPGLHVVLKKIAKQDKERLATVNDGEEKEETCVTFSHTIIDKVTKDVLAIWLPLNRGCFFLINLYENALDTKQAQLKNLIKENFQNLLKKQKHQGAKILLTKINC